MKTAERIGFCGSAPMGRDVYRCSLAESLLSPSGAADPRPDSAPDGACELFLPELYTFRAAGASQIPNPQNPVRSGKLKTPFVIFVVNSWV
jgi:hypothetical protein